MAGETYLGFVRLQTRVRGFCSSVRAGKATFQDGASLLFFMNVDLLHAAGAIVCNDQIVVNVVRLRVRQLAQGHRPLVGAPPGTGTADIALMEIIQNKIRFAPAVEADDAIPLPAVLKFQNVRAKKIAA